MTDHANTLLNTFNWFEIARPQSSPHTFSVQFGVHLEEVAETLEAIQPEDDLLETSLRQAQEALHTLGNMLKSGEYKISYDDLLRLKLLDGLSDTIVTSVGCAHALQMNIIGAMDEVNRSNFSKFEDGVPVIKPGGEIGKGKDYTPPVLDPYI